ncbi:MAG TPA: hypothetical protein VKU82_06835 [Planctomycetaceae bacterium]|nr:hypothetical protein [Planctomycetaceae bacterium]
MTLQPDAKREPFRAPPREPIPDDDAAPGAGEIAAAPVSIEAAPALQTLIDVSPAAGFAAAIPADVVPPGFEPTTAATPSQEIEKSADQTTGAAPSSGEAAGLPDEFGAGLGN